MSETEVTTLEYIPVDALRGESKTLEAFGCLPAVRHRCDAPDLRAINVALAARRPLLIKGEPGTGKSQLARAAAFLLGRNFVWRVMNANTTIDDLFYDFDAVGRLAQAQVMGALAANKGLSPQEIEARLDERRFVTPGVLWRAFDRGGAKTWLHEHGERSWIHEAETERPYVVLIDEIDKTDPSVPNGLLEALGQGTFSVLRDKGTVSLPKGNHQPLIIITTNEERELPAAFVRRCMVHHMRVPGPGDEDPSLEDWLVERGRTHFEDAGLSDELLRNAAHQVAMDRRRALDEALPPPGQAEYLDLLRALSELGKDLDDDGKGALLAEIKDLALCKHVDPRERNVKHGGRA